jgi:hypothetical protein
MFLEECIVRGVVVVVLHRVCSLSSNQSQKLAKPCWTRYLVARKLNQGSTVSMHVSDCPLVLIEADQDMSTNVHS